MLPDGQCRLDRFGFGCFSTGKNPIVHPLPVFGPKGPPPVPSVTVAMQSFWTCKTARSSLKSLKQFASCPRCIRNKK